jgi:hypothetical protein
VLSGTVQNAVNNKETSKIYFPEACDDVAIFPFIMFDFSIDSFGLPFLLHRI